MFGALLGLVRVCARRRVTSVGLCLGVLLVSVGIAWTGLAGPATARAAKTPAAVSRPAPVGASALALLSRQWAKHETWLASPAARSARVSSQGAFAHEDDASARSTDQKAFPGWIGAPGLQSLGQATGGKLLRSFGANDALVSDAAGRTSVVDGELPLLGKTSAGKSAPVDLNLVASGQSFVPSSALDAVSIPGSSDGEVTFPSGFGMRFGSGSAVQGSQSGATVFYPNLGGEASDTDAVVQAAPEGAEISYVLRSQASPDSQVLSFDLPGGWTLQNAGDQSGAVEVVANNGNVIANIMPPLASDAQGQTVPAAYQIENGDQLVISVQDQSGSFAFPIVVDPLIADYTAGGYSDWAHVQYDGSFTATNAGLSMSGGAGTGPGSESAWEMKPSTYYPAGAYAEFRRSAPAGAYIYELDESGVDHHAWQSLEIGGIMQNDGSTWEPGTWANLTNPASGSGAHHAAGGSLTSNDFQYCVVSGCGTPALPGIDGGNIAVFGIQEWNAATQPATNPAWAQQQDATLHLADAQVPSLSLTHSGYVPGSWINTNVSDKVTPTGSVTTGLGMSQLSISGVSPAQNPIIANCSSAVTSSSSPTNPCPLSLTGSFTYSTSSLPEGSNTVSVTATNAGGNNTTKSWAVNIDRTAPTLTLSGPLATQTGPLTGGSYELDLSATDGTGSVPVSGVSQFTVAVDGTTQSGLSSYTPCTSGQTQCTLTSSWTLNSSNLSSGSHTITVTTKDGAGNSTTKTLNVTVAAAPTNTTPPTIQGTPQAAQTLTAQNGSWSGDTPITYTYQWQSCDPNGKQCANISGATSQTYTAQDGDAGATLQVIVTATNDAGSATATSAPSTLVEPAIGPSCTDAWTGEAGDGAWETTGNWSTGASPTNTDTVCIRGGSTVKVTGSDQGATLQGAAASLTISAGSLSLASTSGSSSLGSLDLTAGSLSNQGQLAMVNSLQWTGGTLSGSGSTTVAAGATATITPTASTTPIIFDAQHFTNQGQLTLNCVNGTNPDDPLTSGKYGLIEGEDSAQFVNNGVMTVSMANHMYGCEWQQADSSIDLFTNNGTLNGSAPSGTGWLLGYGYGPLQLGWQFASSIGAVVSNLQISVFGGQAAPIDGTWQNSTLDLAAGGQYTFATTSQFGTDGDNQADIYTDQSPGNTATEPYTAFSQWIAGNSTTATMSVAGIDWQYAKVFLLGGSAAVGSPSEPTSFGDMLEAEDGSSLNMYGEISAYDLIAYNANVDCQGDLTVADDLWTQNESFSVSGNLTVAQSGSLQTYNGSLSAHTIGFGGGWLQSTQVTSQTTITASAGVQADGNTVINAPGNMSFGGLGEDKDPYTVTGGGTLTIAGTLSGDATIDGETVVVNGGGVVESGGESSPGTIRGENGAVLKNFGTMISGNFVTAPSADPPTLVNETGGSMVNYWGSGYTNYVGWPYQGGGSVAQASWMLEGGAGSWYGGKNPASPNSVVPSCGDPVICASGDQTESQTDLSVQGLGGPLQLVRNYNSQLAASQTSPGPFGYGWTSSFEAHLWVNTQRGLATVEQPNGSQTAFTTDANGNFVADTGVEATLTGTSDGGYDYVLPDQEDLKFNSAGDLLSDTNRQGQITTFAYNGDGQLTTVTAPSGRQITFTYNDQGLIATASDPAGLTVSYGYDGNQNLTSVTDSAGPAATRWQFGYDDQHELTSMTDANNNTTKITYQALQVTSQTDQLNRTRTWAYSADQTLVTSPAGNVTQYLFNDQGEPLSITRGYGTSYQATETLQYNPAGEVVSDAGGNGHATIYGYDAAGNRTSQTDPNNHETQWSYDTQRDVLTRTLPSGLQTTYTYNGQGLPTSVVTTGPGDQSETLGYGYNDAGELTSQTDARNKTSNYGYDSYGDLTSVTDPTGDQTTYSYDDDGRQTATISPAGNVSGADPFAHMTSNVYDALGDLTSTTDPVNGTTSYTYDGDQNVLSVKDPNNRTTSYGYDADNELTTITLPDNTIEARGYGLDGNLIAQSDGNKNTTNYTYTPLDQLQTVTDPLNNQTSYSYDQDGNLLTVTDPESRTTTYGYNPGDQLTSVSYSDGTTPNVSYTYEPDGQTATMSDGTGTTNYTYDSLDRLTNQTNGDNQQVTYGYNADNQVTAVGYPNSQTVNQTYDDSGRLQSVSDWLGNNTSFAYTPDSTLQSTSYPASTSETDSYSYNNADQLTGIQMNQGTTVLASLNYTRDPAGQLTNETQTGLPGATSTDYTYTPNEQLATAGTNSYSYDNARNITQLDSQSGYQYNNGNQLTSSPIGTYGYDNLGERTSYTPTGGTSTDYTYNQAGQLTSVNAPARNAVTYAYDGAGLLSSETSGVTTNQFAWNATSSLPLLLTDGHTSYIYGPDEVPIEQVADDGTVSYLHHDQLGSTRLMTDHTGSEIGAETYSPYGLLANSTGSASSPFGYAGQYTDPLSGLQYDRARFYDPTTAQFLSIDPLQQETWQAYGYANNNPVSTIDPSGAIGIDTVIEVVACDNDPIAALGCAAAGGLASWIGIKLAQQAAGNQDVIADGPGLQGEFNQALYEQGVRAASCNAAEGGDGSPEAFLDGLGRVHGKLPSPADLGEYNTEELQILRDELEQSVQARIGNRIELGPDPGHDARIAEEQSLIRSIDKHLGDHPVGG